MADCTGCVEGSACLRRNGCQDVALARKAGIAQGRALERKAIADFLAENSGCETGCQGCYALQLRADIERGEHAKGEP